MRLQPMGHAATLAIGAATLSAYTHLLVVFPETLECEWTGLAYVNGSTAWINGEPTVQAAAHELGHNLGLGHASSLRCLSGGLPVALGSDCTKAEEYGDPFTLMGSGGTLHMSGVHKLQLGWLGPANVIDVTKSGTFALAPLGTVSVDAQILQIPRGKSTLVVEYRQSGAAFERFGGPFEPPGGVTVRMADGPASERRSLLVDSTPRTATHADATIAAGLAVDDTESGLRIRVVSLTSTHAEVEVTLPASGGTGSSSERPTPPSTLVAVTTPGPRRTRVDLSWSESAADRGAIHYVVMHNGRVVARPDRPRLTRFERHGRHVYRVVAVARDGRRSARSKRLVIATERPRSTGRNRLPLRGVKASLTRDGRVALSTRGRTRATVRMGAVGGRAAIPRRGKLALQLSTERMRLTVRPAARPAARAVRIIAVRERPLAG